MQLANPSEPAMAVSMAINILSSLPQLKEPPLLPSSTASGAAFNDEFWVFLFTCLIFSLTFILVSFLQNVDDNVDVDLFNVDVGCLHRGAKFSYRATSRTPRGR